MTWNWQKKDWPQFRWKKECLAEFETQFLRNSGVLAGAAKHCSDEDKTVLIVETMAGEAVKTSEIEGEYLNRDSVQSSIRRHFGLNTDNRRVSPAERGVAEMMVDLYRNFAEPLSHDMLYRWHGMLTAGRNDLKDVGRYRTHAEPMEVISGPLHKPRVHFEAPPSEDVKKEMDRFVAWFARTAPSGKEPLPPLTRAGVAHLYFISVHPFEDGNGRIARVVAEKTLSEGLGEPALIALSRTIQGKRKAYYDMLEASNKDVEITDWLLYFARAVLDAQDYVLETIDFLIAKTKLYDRAGGLLNERQGKAVERMFREGPEGFKGGLSAENYIGITGASRATATRDLQFLVEKGVLIREGELKGTRYRLDIPQRRRESGKKGE